MILVLDFQVTKRGKLLDNGSKSEVEGPFTDDSAYSPKETSPTINSPNPGNPISNATRGSPVPTDTIVSSTSATSNTASALNLSHRIAENAQISEEPPALKEEPQTCANDVDESESKSNKQKLSSPTTMVGTPTINPKSNTVLPESFNSAIKSEDSESKTDKAETHPQNLITVTPRMTPSGSLLYTTGYGLDEQVQFVWNNILYPFANKEALALKGVEVLKGIVFHGPSDAGKVAMVEAIIAELSQLTGQPVTFLRRRRKDVFPKISIRGLDFIRSLFNSAESSWGAPYVILIEDIETLIPPCPSLGKLRPQF